MSEHYLDASTTQPFWDATVEPRLVIQPGDTVVMECAEPCGQVMQDWDSDDIAQLDFGKVHALTGSIYVDGAEPGDALVIEIRALEHQGWGWTGHIPNFGLLADEFDFGFLHHWRLEGERCHFGEAGIVLPYEPFPGCLGVAPPLTAGRLNTVPPRQNGGNLDCRDATIGATMWLPVNVPGALFAGGDCHANQGQGEVCGTAIEAPMTMTIRYGLVKGANIPEMCLQRGGPSATMHDHGSYITSAHGPDLMENAKNAIRYMIEHLGAEYGLSPSLAYCLCSTAVDLKIAEIVDAPNWLVTASLPLSIFEE